MTENHNLNTPTPGTVDWHLPLNDNFSALDTDVEIRDTDANRSTYTPKQGAKFEATDTGAIYLGDGTSWVLVDRQIGSLTAETAFLGHLAAEPTDAEIGSGHTAMYATAGGNIYKKPFGGSETRVGGGSTAKSLSSDLTVGAGESYIFHVDPDEDSVAVPSGVNFIVEAGATVAFKEV